ncbi:MAG: butyrate kinase [Clostridiales Family XIII bacterium]|jgi:butyrate kinase|nr:butyrate kinase [Clostridiales Family XIII bacterium]
MGKRILVINPGSTSTKVAMYDDESRLWDASIEHSLEDLKPFPTILDQVDMRFRLVEETMRAQGYDAKDLDAVVSRGGPFATVESGAYEIGEAMLEKMRTDPIDNHASNTGMEIAYRIGREAGIPAYIYDAVTVDEMLPVCRVVGMKGMARRGQGHNLNMRASALRLCREQGWDYAEKTILVAHLGGGISLSIHQNGRIVDMISDDEGPFAPERAGGLPNFQLIDLCFSEGMTRAEVLRRFQRAGGLISLLGTADLREVGRRVDGGDAEAALVYEAMALSVAKNLAKLAPVACGRIDAVVLTGGIAQSERFTGLVKERAGFLAPVYVLPGENEMEALALGALRVLRGEEAAKAY